MRQPVHAITHRKEMTPEHVVGIGFVAVLHVIVVWAIVTGLAQKIVHAVAPKDITIIDIKKPDQPPPPKPTIPDVKLPTQHTSLVAPPTVVIHDDAPVSPLVVDRGPPQQRGETRIVSIADTFATGVAGTHTIPPYPELDRRLGNQGTVELKLSISPQGIVMAADVVKSSGFARLDQAAQSWVIQHWKYKPATKGGEPVASTTTAAVMFSIRNAG